MSIVISNLKGVGKDVFIAENVVIRRPHLACMGSHVAIDFGFYCTTKIEIGDYVHIAPYVTVIGGENGLLKMGNFTNISVRGNIICGSDTFLGDGLITAPGIPHDLRDKLKIAPIIFEDFANIGADVTILPGVTLAQGSVIGACSLVTKDTEPWTIYIGNPAKPFKMRKKERIIENAKKLGYEL